MMTGNKTRVKLTTAEQRLSAEHWRNSSLNKKADGETPPALASKKRKESLPENAISSKNKRGSGKILKTEDEVDQEVPVKRRKLISPGRLMTEPAASDRERTPLKSDGSNGGHRETISKREISSSSSSSSSISSKKGRGGGRIVKTVDDADREVSVGRSYLHSPYKLREEPAASDAERAPLKSVGPFSSHYSEIISIREISQSGSSFSSSSSIATVPSPQKSSSTIIGESRYTDNISPARKRQDAATYGSSSLADNESLRPSRRSSGPFSSISHHSATSPCTYIAAGASSASPTLPVLQTSAESDGGDSVSVPWPEQLVEVAEFACKRSAVMPSLPAGTLPLLWAVVFFIGMALMAYMGLCDGHGVCKDPLPMLTSLSHMDGESAGELFERARASVAPTADYVVEQLKLMWSKICAGQVSELSQLLTDKDIRVAVLMYLGAVIALFGGYLTFATMDYSFSNSYAQLVSSFNTTERLASVTEMFEANSASFWKDAAELAPTPSISMSSFFIGAARAVQWAVKSVTRNTPPVKAQTEEMSAREESKIALERHASSSMSTPADQGSDISSDLDARPPPLSSSAARLRKQCTIFLRARKPQILSFCQRLDVSAAIVAMLLLLLLLFLYHKTIKQIFSFCVVPSVCAVMGFGAGRVAFVVYRSILDRREFRIRQIASCSTLAKRHLQKTHSGGPYPVDFLFEELKDIILDGTVEEVMRSDTSLRSSRTSFGATPPRSHKINSEGEDQNHEVDLKKFTLLWREVVRDVLMDKRVLNTVIIFDGAKRNCWKFLGAKPPPTPTPTAVMAEAKAFTPIHSSTSTSSRVHKRGDGLVGWTLFTVETLWWGASGLVRAFVYILTAIWNWLRK